MEDCWFLRRENQHDVLTRQEPLQPDLWLQVAPGDVGDDDAIRPEVDIWSLTVVCEVLDVDCLLVKDKNVPGHGVGGVRELSQVDGLRLGLAGVGLEAQ